MDAALCRDWICRKPAHRPPIFAERSGRLFLGLYLCRRCIAGAVVSGFSGCADLVAVDDRKGVFGGAAIVCWFCNFEVYLNLFIAGLGWLAQQM